ncbi:MAG: signal peptidase I [Pseudomonadota bacterium]
MNLELILVALTAITGLMTLWHWWQGRGGDETVVEQTSSGTGEFLRSFFPVLLLVLVLRSFIFEPFRIPSGSMKPTLLEGDFVFVSKFSYGIRLPLVHTELFATGRPQRGDVAVFRKPSDPSQNYIKRVIGLPGDRIDYRQGRLRINGELIKAEPTGRFEDDHGTRGVVLTEYLPNRPHSILDIDSRPLSREAVVQVPDGCYFMMGDNRENSTDSRYPQVGCVDEKYLVGRAGRIWFNVEWGRWPRWSRIGTKIE